MQRVAAWALVLAVQAAAVSAPLVHAHPDGHDDDHRHEAAVHAHFAPHHGPRASGATVHVEADEGERAIYLQVYLAVTPPSFDVALAPATTFELAPPAESPARRPVEIVHGHDPPRLALLPSRAPPASFLS